MGRRGTADSRDHVAALQPPPGGLRLRTGIVDTTSPLTVFVGGSSTAVPARRLTSYTPGGSDHVAILEQDGDLLVLGEIA